MKNLKLSLKIVSLVVSAFLGGLSVLMLIVLLPDAVNSDVRNIVFFYLALFLLSASLFIFTLNIMKEGN